MNRNYLNLARVIYNILNEAKNDLGNVIVADGKSYPVGKYKYITLDSDGVKLHETRPTHKADKFVSKSFTEIASARFDYNRIGDDFGGQRDAQRFANFIKGYGVDALCHDLDDFGEFDLNEFLESIEYIKQYTIFKDELSQLVTNF